MHLKDLVERKHNPIEFSGWRIRMLFSPWYRLKLFVKLQFSKNDVKSFGKKETIEFFAAFFLLFSFKIMQINIVVKKYTWNQSDFVCSNEAKELSCIFRSVFFVENTSLLRKLTKFVRFFELPCVLTETRQVFFLFFHSFCHSLSFTYFSLVISVWLIGKNVWQKNALDLTAEAPFV